MNFTLRDYQAAAAEDIRAAYRQGARAPLLVMPTASGKTVLFSYIAEQAGLRGSRVMILVHRRELLTQTSRTLDGFGIKHGLISAGISFAAGSSVQVASVQTLVRRMTRMRWTPDLIIVDEAHHATSKTTWGKVLAHYATAKVLGVTATPQRLDGQGLGTEEGGFFNALVLGPSVAELTARGYLSPAVTFAPPVRADISGVHTRCGDFASGELAAAMDKPRITGDAVAHYRAHCHGHPAIAFCASVAHAEHVAEAFRLAGFQAASVDGTMDVGTRTARISDLGSGRLQVLTSCDLISEGTDIPVVSAAILLRPTQSLALHLQTVGRALRLAPGKTHATILDHVGNSRRHGLHDDEREWTLSGRQRSANGDAESAAPVRQCERCYHVHRPAPRCPACGLLYPVQEREIEEVAGTLEQIHRPDGALSLDEARRKARLDQARADSLEKLTDLARARGYKNPPAWAHFVWQARKGRAVA